MKLEELLAVPYNLDGDSIETGFNCYTLVCFVRKTFFDLETPGLLFDNFEPENSAVVIKQQEHLWGQTETPVPGDVVVMRRDSKIFWHHCGVYLPGHRVIHTFHSLRSRGKVIIHKIQVAQRLFPEVCFAKWPV